MAVAGSRVLVLAACGVGVLLIAGRVLAQRDSRADTVDARHPAQHEPQAAEGARPRTNRSAAGTDRQAEGEAEAPPATGKVSSYQPNQSITIEVQQRRETRQVEFRVVRERTKIELPPRQQEIRIGIVLSVWADKEDPTLAARIAPAGGDAPAQGTRRPNRRPDNTDPPGTRGQIAAYEAEKSITVEVKQRGGQTRKTEFNIVKDRTKIELAGDAKEIEVGLPVTVWSDKDEPQLAARIVAGQNTSPPPRTRRPSNNPTNPNPARTPPGDNPSASIAPAAPRPPRQPVAGLAPHDVARRIDQHVEARLAAENVPASQQCDDAEFIRRACLDITGVIPPADRVTAFLDDDDPGKRARLIDELLASPAYGRHFANLWCERIVTRDLAIETEPFVRWMADGLNENRGWNEVVHDLLTAEGSFSFATRGRRMATGEPQAFLLLVNTDNAVAGRVEPKAEWLAAECGRLFLGVQIQCAECHDHPFTDSWKQNDFWGLAAFFGQLRAARSQPAGGGGGLLWQELPAAAHEPAQIVIPATSLLSVGTIVPARLLGADQDYRPGDQELLRHSLARWITSPDNPFFARATANRMWAHFFGRGLVHPVDDLRPDNPPSHPAVLELLAAEFRRSEYDLPHLIRCICLSQAWQRTSVLLAGNAQDRENYSHMAIKVLGPGALYDSLAIATGFPELQVGLPKSKTVVTTITTLTPRESFVEFYRAAAGEEPDPLEYMHGIPQKLKLLNATQLNGVFPTVTRLVGRGLDRTPMIEQLYLTALARRPTADEAGLMADFLAQRADAAPEQGYSAVLWALINTSEFVLNR